MTPLHKRLPYFNFRIRIHLLGTTWAVSGINCDESGCIITIYRNRRPYFNFAMNKNTPGHSGRDHLPHNWGGRNIQWGWV